MCRPLPGTVIFLRRNVCLRGFYRSCGGSAVDFRISVECRLHVDGDYHVKLGKGNDLP